MTFEHDAVVVTLASRASIQVREGLAALTAGRLLESQVFLNAAAATMQSLIVLLESPPPPKPMRRFVVVGTNEVPDDEEMPEWFDRKANSGGEPDGAA